VKHASTIKGLKRKHGDRKDSEEDMDDDTSSSKFSDSASPSPSHIPLALAHLKASSKNQEGKGDKRRKKEIRSAMDAVVAGATDQKRSKGKNGKTKGSMTRPGSLFLEQIKRRLLSELEKVQRANDNIRAILEEYCCESESE
jgi:hypothetical protein